MAIHGKQLKDASIDLTKLEGIAATPTEGQLLVAGSNGSMQALTVGGNLSASVSGSTLDLSIGAGTIQLSMIDANAIVSEAEGIGSNDNDTTIPTSAAVKDYVDTQVTAQDLDFTGDSGTGAVDLDSQSLIFVGGTGIDTSALDQKITIGVDSSVATLAGSQTLTNKTLTSAVLDTGVSGTAILDEDNMASNSATQLATQQSIKAYVDAQVSSSGSALELTAGTGSASIALATETLSVAGGANISTVASSTLNSLTVSLDPHISLTSATLSGALSVGGNAVITGDLTVNGTTTTVNSTTVTVDDKNLELGSVATPTDTTADGGGITLKGATDKTFNWVDATDAWTSSEHMNLASTKSYHIAGTELLVATGVKKIDEQAIGGSGNKSGLSVDGANELALDIYTLSAAGSLDPANDSIVISSAGNSNNSELLPFTSVSGAIAGDGLASTSGVLSTSMQLEYKVPANTLLAGNLIALSSAPSVAYTAPAYSGDMLLSVNGISYELGTSSGSGDYFVDSNRNIEWNSTAFSLDSGDKITLTYIPA